MTRSMTGFGRATFEAEARRFEIEVRSVNHRHLDLRVRLPHSLQDLEPSARTLCQDRLVRGKVDVNVASSDRGSGEAMLEVDAGLAEQYVSAAQQLAETHGLSAEIDISRLLSMPGVVRQVDARLTTEGRRLPSVRESRRPWTTSASCRQTRVASWKRSSAGLSTIWWS